VVCVNEADDEALDECCPVWAHKQGICLPAGWQDKQDSQKLSRSAVASNVTASQPVRKRKHCELVKSKGDNLSQKTGSADEEDDRENDETQFHLRAPAVPMPSVTKSQSARANASSPSPKKAKLSATDAAIEQSDESDDEPAHYDGSDSDDEPIRYDGSDDELPVKLAQKATPKTKAQTVSTPPKVEAEDEQADLDDGQASEHESDDEQPANRRSVETTAPERTLSSIKPSPTTEDDDSFFDFFYSASSDARETSTTPELTPPAAPDG
jgi:hypothetical protein